MYVAVVLVRGLAGRCWRVFGPRVRRLPRYLPSQVPRALAVTVGRRPLAKRRRRVAPPLGAGSIDPTPSAA